MALTQKHINQIRNFNRFYTSIIGVLDQHMYQTPYSLSEARILFEINERSICTARQIKETIKMDEGYLSRIIEKFVNSRLIKKKQSEKDARVYNLSLTTKGRKIFSKLNAASDREVTKLTKGVSSKDLDTLIKNMEHIMITLSK